MPGQNGHQPGPASPASSTTSDGSGNSGCVNRSEPPKRLRYWLIDMINGGSIPGLQWENADKSIFRIPWKHAGKNNWREEDCRIFKAWAEHRGKYKPGDKLDAATWKTRLRCALNKLPDIKELKELSNLESNDPYRVYQLLPEADRSQEFEIYPRNTWGRESSPPNHLPSQSGQFDFERRRSSDLIMTPPLHPHQLGDVVALSGIPARPLATDPSQALSQLRVGESAAGYAVNRLEVAPPPPYDVTQQRPSQTMASDLTNPNPYRGHVYSSMGSSNGVGPPATMNGDTCPTYRNGSSLSQIPDKAPQPFEMEIYIRYRGADVIKCHVTTSHGCRIHYGDANWQMMASATHELPSIVFGSTELQQIELVGCAEYSTSEKQIQLTNHILNNIKRGLIIYYENGCFYAKRLCQSRVFVLGPESKDNEPEKLDRKSPLKIFDYKNYCEKLKQYSAEGRRKAPETEVRASFGQNWSMKSPIEKNLVTLSMVPRVARYLLYKMRDQQSQVPSFNDDLSLASTPNSYDRLADRATTESDHCIDVLMQQMTDGPGSSFFDLINSAPNPPAQQPPQVTPYQSGYFQQNIINPAPIVNISDVEMEVGGEGMTSSGRYA